MNSCVKDCTDLKQKYDTCFQNWFKERYLNGDVQMSVCDSVFKEYQHCLKKAMKEQNIDFKEFEEDILGTEKEYKVPPK